MLPHYKRATLAAASQGFKARGPAIQRLSACFRCAVRALRIGASSVMIEKFTGVRGMLLSEFSRSESH